MTYINPRNQNTFYIISLTYLLAPIPIKIDAIKPNVTAKRSLPDNFNAYFKVLLPFVFLTANEISLPAKSPTKHHVVDIGILEIIFKTNKTIAYKIFTSEASGLSLILDFSLTTC